MKLIISFASSKGGVGKSTTCAAIAARLAQRGDDVLVIDLDQNRTLERWGRKTSISGLTVKAVDRDAFTTLFRETLAAGLTDHILIDLAGAREATALKAIARSDLVVIPAQASEPDLREAIIVAKDVRDVAEEKGTAIPYRTLLTKMPALRTRVADHGVAEMTRKGMPIFRTMIGERVAYKEMFFTGHPPSSSETNGAGAEITALIAEIEEIIGEAARARQTEHAARSA